MEKKPERPEIPGLDVKHAPSVKDLQVVDSPGAEPKVANDLSEGSASKAQAMNQGLKQDHKDAGLPEEESAPKQSSLGPKVEGGLDALDSATRPLPKAER